MKKIIALLTLFVTVFLCVSCGKDCHEEILGKWDFSQKLRQELYLDDQDPESYLGNVFIEQEISYTFKEDMTYEKIIYQLFTKAEPSEMENPEYDINDYVGIQSLAIITGEYKATQKVIKLNAQKISFGNDENMDYAEYYLDNPYIGVQKTSRKYTKDGDTLIINSLETGQDEKFIRAAD